MKGALIRELGRPPEAAQLELPPVGDGELVVEVLAASLNPLDVNVANGRFYGGHPPLPYVPGCECVGRRVGDDSGRLVWVFGAGVGLARNGAIAERAVVPSAAVYDVPDGADPAVACALGIAGLAGWMPVATRAPVREGETVLVLGATGAVGMIAVQAAKALGAGRVIGAGRDEAALGRVRELGADVVVSLDNSGEVVAEEKPSLVIDPLWGPVIEAVVAAAAPRTRIVNLGQSAGPEAMLTSAAVRGKELEILGHSNFAHSHDVLQREYTRLVEHAVAGRITIDVECFAVDAIGEAWARQNEGAHAKLVVGF